MSCVICCDALLNDINFLGSPDASKDPDDWERQPAALGCGHVFHLGCIGLWLEQSNRGTCPTCRKVHNSPPIGLYFEVDTPSSNAAETEAAASRGSSSQVTHRNQIIQMLCKNAKAAQDEIKQMKDQIRKLANSLEEREAAYGEQTRKAKKLADKVIEAKKHTEKWKKLELKFMADMANRDSMIEQLTTERTELKQKEHELASLKESMDSMRVSNERLQRALKKERARNSTLSDVNKKLVSKMHLMEEEAAGGAEGSPAVSSESHLPQNSQQTGTFAEDLDASSTELDPVVPNGWAVPQATKPLTKLKPTYNMPLSKFADVGLSSDSESASETKLGHTMSPFTATSRNPFSVAGTSSPHTIMPAGVFSFRAHLPEAPSRMPGTPSIKSGHQPASRKLTDTRTARRSNTVFVSDGMGGSRSQHAARKTTTQAKITWGPRKA